MSRILTLLILGCLTAIGFTAYSMLYGGGTNHIRVPTVKRTGVKRTGSAVSNGDATTSAAPATTAEVGAGEPIAADSTPKTSNVSSNVANGRGETADDSANRERSKEEPTNPADSLAAAVTSARRSHSASAVTRLVEKLESHLVERPKDRDGWRHLATALLQKVVQRGHLLGMRPGRPVYSELPAEIATDLDAAQSALDRAHELGDDSAERHLLAAEIMSQRITGLATALEWNSRIEAAIAAAGERNSDAPQLHLVLGVRKLLAPRFFGQDVEASLEHFHYVAAARPADERPAIFAAMAFYLSKKRLAAIEWLEKAVTRNPNNVFAQVVLTRLRRGEKDPFGRNVTPTEAAAIKPK